MNDELFRRNSKKKIPSRSSENILRLSSENVAEVRKRTKNFHIRFKRKISSD